jgi:acyl-coenzyme A synthetase/AMP-(fatty) acid ligase
MFFQTSCGWMMWNWQLSGSAYGAEVVCYDGPLKGPETLWGIVPERGVTVFGTNPAHHMRAGQLVALESTTYPGTTRKLVSLPTTCGRGTIFLADSHPNATIPVISISRRSRSQ